MTNILLTGSSRGIGAAIAANLNATPDISFVGHGTASGIPADFADPAGPHSLWDAALKKLGTIDVLINNAGVFEANPIDLDDAAWVAGWERTMRINLTASAELCRLAIRHWQERGVGGRIQGEMRGACGRFADTADGAGGTGRPGSLEGLVEEARGRIQRGHDGEEEIERRPGGAGHSEPPRAGLRHTST